jgi:hypothetical protein
MAIGRLSTSLGSVYDICCPSNRHGPVGPRILPARRGSITRPPGHLFKVGGTAGITGRELADGPNVPLNLVSHFRVRSTWISAGPYAECARPPRRLHIVLPRGSCWRFPARSANDPHRVRRLSARRSRHRRGRAHVSRRRRCRVDGLDVGPRGGARWSRRPVRGGDPEGDDRARLGCRGGGQGNCAGRRRPRQCAGLNATPQAVCVEGGAAQAILRAADEHDVMSVVVGSRGRSGFRSALLGSVSNTVVQHPAKPVVVVHDPAENSR